MELSSTNDFSYPLSLSLLFQHPQIFSCSCSCNSGVWAFSNTSPPPLPPHHRPPNAIIVSSSPTPSIQLQHLQPPPLPPTSPLFPTTSSPSPRSSSLFLSSNFLSFLQIDPLDSVALTFSYTSLIICLERGEKHVRKGLGFPKLWILWRDTPLWR